MELHAPIVLTGPQRSLLFEATLPDAAPPERYTHAVHDLIRKGLLDAEFCITETGEDVLTERALEDLSGAGGSIWQR